MKIQDSTNKVYKGINQDTSPVELNDDAYTWGLNVVYDSMEGDAGNLISEPSNVLCAELPVNYKVIGSIYGQDGNKYVFSTNNVTTRIDQIDSYCNLTQLVETDCFGYTYDDIITGEYRVRKGCERQLYWNSNSKYDYQFNIDSAEDYQTDGEWDCNKFRLQPQIEPIDMALVAVNESGGNLPLGAYYFQAEVLDESLNVVYRNHISQAVNIVDDPLNGAYDQIDGGLNIASNLEDVGGVPVTNKSITVEFSNLPSEFKYLRLNVITAATGDGETVTAYRIGNIREIASDTLRITYTGYNPSAGDIEIDYTSLIQGVTEYNSSSVMEQVQNRLVRANMIQRTRDYSGFQQLANKITTTYAVEEIDALDQLTSGNPKNPNTTWEKMSHMGDEVYAYAIVYGFPDGESPAFHIPGRIAINNDIVNVRDNVGIEDVRHLGVTEADLNDETFELPKWKVFNTSQGSGQMAYWESSERYPTTTDCNGDYIYPVEEVDGEIVGQYIRHHRFPCRTTEPHYENGNIRLLGITFDNVQYPDGATYHYFVRARRDDFNKTVLDNGYLMPLLDDDVSSVTPRTIASRYPVGSNLLLLLQQTDSSNWMFFSPETQFNKKYLNGTHFKFHNSVSYENFSENNCDSYLNDFDVFSDYVDSIQFDTTNINVRSFSDNLYINRRSFQPQTGDFTTDLFNPSYSNDYNYYRLYESLPLPAVDNWQAYYVSAKRYLPSLYSNLNTVIYYRTHNNRLSNDSSNTLYGGDVYISKFQHYNLWGYSTDKDASVDYAGEMWVESEINVGYRHAGTDCNTYFDLTLDENNLCDYTLTKIATFENNANIERNAVCPEYYGYNDDYSRLSKDSAYISLPITYDYCAKCLNKNPFRIIFSPQSFDIEISDTYRIANTDDYIDLPGHRGAITGIKYKNNKLIVHTEQTTFLLQPNPQFIATDQNSAYLNTGDFLSIPPYELQQTDLGYGGLQHRTAMSNSENAYAWVDTKIGNVITFTNGIQNINTGLNRWLQSNLSFQYYDEVFALTGEKPKIDDHVNSIGLQTIYDPNFKRLIVHKKDYVPTELLKSRFRGVVENSGQNTGMNQNGVYYGKDGLWALWDNNFGISAISFDDTDYFYDVSWTLSYSYLMQSWTSWHSYMPDFMFNDESYFYTSKENKIYRHLEEHDYTRFYDVQYPFIIEYVENDYTTANLFSIQYFAEFQKYIADNDVYVPQRDVNYTNLIVYNDVQSTGKLNILNNTNTVYQNVVIAPNEKSVMVKDGNSKIAGIYNMGISNNIVTANNEQLIAERALNGYIDTVPINIDFDRPQFQWDYMHNKYNKIRLFYYPEDSTIKTVHRLNNNRKQISIR